MVDVDGADNGWLRDDPDKLLDLAGAPMSVTPRGGSHRVFRKPDGKTWGNSAGKLADQVDTRSDGGYIVVSPSTVDGRPYQWQPGCELADGPEALPEPPEWLQTMLDEITRKPEPKAHGNNGDGEATEGKRNDYLFRLASRLRRAGLEPTEILAALTEANRRRCSPPLPEDEVRQIAENAGRYKPGAQNTLPLTDSGNAERFARQHKGGQAAHGTLRR